MEVMFTFPYSCTFWVKMGLNLYFCLSHLNFYKSVCILTISRHVKIFASPFYKDLSNCEVNTLLCVIKKLLTLVNIDSVQFILLN